MTLANKPILALSKSELVSLYDRKKCEAKNSSL